MSLSSCQLVAAIVCKMRNLRTRRLDRCSGVQKVIFWVIEETFPKIPGLFATQGPGSLR
jgi:hypothetical protein